MSDAPGGGRVRLVVAQVRGLHGLRGAVRVEVLTDRPEDRFAVGRSLHPEGSGRVLTIAAAEPVADGPGWRLRFREVSSRTAAEPLRAVYLEAEVDPASDLPSEAVYWHELEGLEVTTGDGRVLGRVAEIYRAGEAEVLVVRGDAGGEIDIPIVRDIVRVFAPRDGRIIVDEAALDLDGPPVDERPPARVAPRRRWSRHGKGAEPEA